jgi:hypothetical protein
MAEKEPTMRSTTYEPTKTIDSAATDTTEHEPTPIPLEEDDDQEKERQSPNMSMDEVREILDEFEEILRSCA